MRYRVCAAAGAVLASFSVGLVDSPEAEAGPQYRVHGVPWPGGLVKYYNAAPSQAWATDDVPRYAWPSETETFSRVVAQPPPGRYCFAVWSIDAFGRPSGRAAADWVQVPG